MVEAAYCAVALRSCQILLDTCYLQGGCISILHIKYYNLLHRKVYSIYIIYIYHIILMSDIGILKIITTFIYTLVRSSFVDVDGMEENHIFRQGFSANKVRYRFSLLDRKVLCGC